jgi:hypothetical protein
LDNNFRKLQRILGRGPEKKEDKGKGGNGRQWNFQKRERDPNAMDVDAMSVERRDEMMKKGLCFGCGGQGHLSKNCPNKKAKPSTSTPITSTSAGQPPAYTVKKTGAKELYTHV